MGQKKCTSRNFWLLSATRIKNASASLGNFSFFSPPGPSIEIRSIALFGHTVFIKILKNVGCEYDRWVVETQLCKQRGT